MSQAGLINISGGGGGGSPIQTVTGDSGGPVPPTANNINLLGGTSSTNNANGITVVGNAGTSTETFTLTNRQNGSVTTSDATPTTLISFTASASATIYNLQFKIAAFDATDTAGAAYHVDAGARTTGAAVTIFPDADFVDNEEAAMAATDINVVASGNNIILQVTGIAGKTIRWNGQLNYIQVV